MIIHQRDIVRVTIFPNKDQSPLLVNPNAPVTLAVAGELLQPIAGWKQHIFNFCRRIQRLQPVLQPLAQCRRNCPGFSSFPESLKSFVVPAFYHTKNVSNNDT